MICDDDKLKNVKHTSQIVIKCKVFELFEFFVFLSVKKSYFALTVSSTHPAEPAEGHQQRKAESYSNYHGTKPTPQLQYTLTFFHPSSL